MFFRSIETFSTKSYFVQLGDFKSESPLILTFRDGNSTKKDDKSSTRMFVWRHPDNPTFSLLYRKRTPELPLETYGYHFSSPVKDTGHFDELDGPICGSFNLYGKLYRFTKPCSEMSSPIETKDCSYIKRFYFLVLLKESRRSCSTSK